MNGYEKRRRWKKILKVCAIILGIFIGFCIFIKSMGYLETNRQKKIFNQALPGCEKIFELAKAYDHNFSIRENETGLYIDTSFISTPDDSDVIYFLDTLPTNDADITFVLENFDFHYSTEDTTCFLIKSKTFLFHRYCYYFTGKKFEEESNLYLTKGLSIKKFWKVKEGIYGSVIL